MTGTELQSKFVRALEAEYDLRVARYKGEGLPAEAVHGRALADVLRVEGEALEKLRRRGLFPWRTDTP